MNSNPTHQGRIPGFSIETDPKVIFETLPPEIRDQYHRSRLVHMHVYAFIHGKITREEMFELLSISVVEENANLTGQIEQFCKLFGGFEKEIKS